MGTITVDATIDVMQALNMVDEESTMLLDSCIQVGDTGDHTLLVFRPEFVLIGDEQEGTTVRYKNGTTEHIDMPILQYMDEYRSKLTEAQRNSQTGQVFNGGFVGYLSYDFGMRLLGIHKENKPSFEIPEVYFGYYTEYVLIDWVRRCTTICTQDDSLGKKLLEKLCDGLCHKVDFEPMRLTSNSSREAFEQSVEQVRQYIKKGEVYQVNLSQQFRGAGAMDALALYQRVRLANYGPYNAYLNLGSFHVLSTSPEQFIRIRNGQITSRPIKGTNRRSHDIMENTRLKEALLASEKDRAELLMIVDLERNDLSKICAAGTVKVEALYVVEEYATVNHLVSTINGTLLEGVTISDIMKAMFPGGSITGAPKIRAMEIIEELEYISRGLYTGSIGYIANNGTMDFNIAIRTTVVNGDGVFYNVGGGITWDSNPCEEFEETLQKGKAIYNVLVGGK